MRVLLVNAFLAASDSNRKRYDAFRHHVLCVMAEIERQDVTHIDIVEKTRHDLDEFLFELHSEFADPQSITNFDRLDFVFVAGDPSASVWAPPQRKLVLLTKMCMLTGKCFYGSGIGAALLAFLCSTAGEPLCVINNSGKGSLLDDVQEVPPPPSALVAEGRIRPGHSAAAGNDVLLDTRTGDYFSFDRINYAWVPRGNTGLMHHTSDHDHAYGARLNTARAGTKKSHCSDLRHTPVATKRGDTHCCCRLDATSHEVLRRSRSSSTSKDIPREFLANCKSAWDLDEPINATGNNKYRVLVDSSRGPMLIEFGNCVGAHFTLAREYPETCVLLRNFAVAKYELLKVHEHIDRSFVSAISGSARLKQRLQLAATKTSAAVAVVGSARSDDLPQKGTHLTTTMTSGRTSPKRCRPVSAGPYRSPVKTGDTMRRPIQTSRSEYPSAIPSDPQRMGAMTIEPFVAEDERRQGSNQHDAREERTSANKPVRPHTARVLLRRPKGELPHEIISPHLDEEVIRETFVSPRPSQLEATKPIKAHRRIRVAQRNELDKPYCAIHKFTSLHASETAQHKARYYSVVNDAPYLSNAERELRDQQQSKLKWVGGPFQSAVGKASTQTTVEASIFAREPFDQRNIPANILQRQQEDRPPASPSSSSRHKTQGYIDKPKRIRPASAAASTRRSQR